MSMCLSCRFLQIECRRRPARYPKEVPAVRDPLQLVLAGVFKGESGAGREVLHGRGGDRADGRPRPDRGDRHAPGAFARGACAIRTTFLDRGRGRVRIPHVLARDHCATALEPVASRPRFLRAERLLRFTT